MIDRQLNLTVLGEGRWTEATHEIVAGNWGIEDQATYYGIRIADAVVLGRTTLARVSDRLAMASLLDDEAVTLSGGDILSLSGDNLLEAMARRLSYRSFREGKRRVKDDNHFRRHKLNYDGRIRRLHAQASGLGRLEARDLNLDDIWYDEGEV